jgi:hypothetical protein
VPTDMQYKRATGWVLHTQDQTPDQKILNRVSCVARALLTTNNFRDGHKEVKQLLTILNVAAMMRVICSCSLHSCSAGHCSGMFYVL